MLTALRSRSFVADGTDGTVRISRQPRVGLVPLEFPALIFHGALRTPVEGEHRLGVFRLCVGMTHRGCRPSLGVASLVISFLKSP